MAKERKYLLTGGARVALQLGMLKKIQFPNGKEDRALFRSLVHRGICAKSPTHPTGYVLTRLGRTLARNDRKAFESC